MARLDVREDLRQGREPFTKIMETVRNLAPEEALELIAPFEPRLLYLVLAEHGFSHEATQDPDGSWRVLFRAGAAQHAAGATMTMAHQPVTLNTSVREVVMRYPQTVAVFERHGIAGCGGPDGPLEPVGFFAAVHRVNPAVLVRELNEAALPQGRGMLGTLPQAQAPAARNGTVAPQRMGGVLGTLPQVQTPEAKDLYPLFLRSSLVVALSLGFTAGVLLLLAPLLALPGAAWWAAHTQIHGQAQLLGWAGLFVMGVAYHVYPRFKRTSLAGHGLALASYGALVVGLVARVLGHVLAYTGAGDLLLPVSALAILVSAGLFALVLFRTARRSPAPWELFDAFIGAAVAWLLVGALANGLISLQLLATGQEVVPQALDEPLVHGLLVGYLVLFTLGVALRTQPMFLHLGAPRIGVIRGAWWLLNGGLLLRVGAGWWGAADPASPALALVPVGTLLEAAGAGAFVAGLGLFRSGGRTGLMPGAYPGFGRFVRVAWGWLLVAVALDAVFALRALLGGGAPAYFEASAVRHALALGFVSLMIFGMAVRIVPTFGGVALAAPKLVDWVFVVFNVGAVLRVVSLLLSPAWPEVFRAVAALSGVLGLIGLVFFAISLWRTLDATARARHAH